MKKLLEMSIEGFLEQLASDCPTPGGGSVAALEAALGAALIEMSARLTAGKPKFAEHEALMVDTIERAYRLRLQLEDLVDMDTDAYNNVTDAYRLPKGTDEEKAFRVSAIQDSLKMATNIPAETMERAEACLALAESINGKVNPNCASDLAVAELSLKAAIEGAYRNVLTNIEGIKDEQFAETVRVKCRAHIKGK